MPFQKALYYPYIEIQDENWLKNSMFYWDKIQTIVPDYMEYPYETITGQELFDANILKPYYVNSEMNEVENLTEDIIQYLTTPEGQNVLKKDTYSDQDYYLYTTKLPNSIKSILKEHQILDTEYSIDNFEKKLEESKDELLLDKKFNDFYMTLLAANISENINAELLTDTDLNDELALRIKLDYDPLNHPNISKGTLIKMIFENMEINSETPIENIISFRDDHSYELLNFKNKIVELSESATNSPPDEIHEITEHVYNNEFLPSLNALKETLKDNEIKWSIGGTVQISTFISSCITLSPNTNFESIALLSAFGISLIASAVSYNNDKKSILRDNPYSYILSVDDSFGV